jgi:hypothetical protein
MGGKDGNGLIDLPGFILGGFTILYLDFFGSIDDLRCRLSRRLFNDEFMTMIFIFCSYLLPPSISNIFALRLRMPLVTFLWGISTESRRGVVLVLLRKAILWVL